MEKEVSKGDNGMALFLGIICGVFMIGIIIFIFITGNNAIKSASAQDVSGVINNESIPFSTICQNTSVSGLDSISLSGVVLKYSNGTEVPAELYTVQGGCVKLNM
jgi:hypothetical protein